MKSKWKNALVATAVSMLLTACGGGGGGGDGAAPLPSPEAANKYVGTWVMACATNGADSEKETISLTKTGANALSFTFERTRFVASTNCSSGAQAPVTSSGSVTLDGQTPETYQGNTVTFDRVTATINGVGAPTIEKWAAAVLPSGRLLIDFDDTPATSGYPTNPTDGSTEYSKAP